MIPAEEQITRILRGTTGVASVDELKTKLSRKKPLRIKLGVDPTSPDIHLGHTVVLTKLRVFQDVGHTVVFIIGDFTAAIGDPSGRDTTRPPLSDEEIKANIKTYQDQVFKILDPSKTEVHHNSEWLLKLFEKDNPDYLPKKILRQHTVQQLMERDDFNERRKAGQPITLLELLYPIFQGYDSVAVKADVEIGGQDQLFNLLVGRQMQKNAGQEPQVVITLPLLEGLDGVRKMSKSYDNHVGVKDPPNQMFAKIMSIPDDVMWKYFELLTEEDLKKLKTMHPKEAKMLLGEIIVTRFHDKKGALGAKEEFERVFSKREVPEEIEDFKLPMGGIDIIDLLVDIHIASSKKEAHRLVEQGGVQLEGRKIGLGEKITVSAPAVLKVGKRRFKKLLPS